MTRHCISLVKSNLSGLSKGLINIGQNRTAIVTFPNAVVCFYCFKYFAFNKLNYWYGF